MASSWYNNNSVVHKLMCTVNTAVVLCEVCVCKHRSLALNQKSGLISTL